ncbi:MAG: MFS transporter [Parachlamydiaceae bacterium]|nr:MFS transporter [Parachlamydiaceae bacterium]
MHKNSQACLNSSLGTLNAHHLSSFSYLNITQSIGAFNDNLYKLLVIFYLIHMQGDEHASRIIALAGAIFILPFLLFARLAGILADTCSKSMIILATRIIGLFLAIGAFFIFYFGSILGVYCMLFAMATNSTIFVITRNSMLPEIVTSTAISNANGVMSSVGFVAIILGTFSASFILDMTSRNYVYSSFLIILTATIAVVTSWFIEHTSPATEKDHHEKIKPFFLAEIYSSLKKASELSDLLSSILGASFFLFFGAFFQLNLIPFVIQSLHFSDLQGGYMFLLCAIGIGVGSVISGKISGKIVELRWVPVASGFMAICLLFMYLYASSLYAIVFLTSAIGLFGGLYDIPLESYIQYKSPAHIRGHIVAATKFMSSFGVLCASGLIYLLSNVLGLNASEGFLILSLIVAVVTVIYAYLYRKHPKQFFCSNDP